VTGAGLHDLADHGIVDVARLDLGALEGSRGCDDAELHRRAGCEPSAQAAEGRTRGGEDDGVGHGGRVPRAPGTATRPTDSLHN
jgi:hypothetical protein